MGDIIEQETRSRMMYGIRVKNTKPELLVSKYLHSRVLRFRLHTKELPEKPDFVFPKYKAVVFVHVCFWHHRKNISQEEGNKCQIVNSIVCFPIAKD